MWDGFQRINTETKNGGIVGVFRQGAIESKRLITVKYLDAKKIYNVKTMDGKIVIAQTGRDLALNGFEVILNKEYDGELFEVSMEK